MNLELLDTAENQRFCCAGRTPELEILQRELLDIVTDQHGAQVILLTAQPDIVDWRLPTFRA
jgi:hypothetical protein